MEENIVNQTDSNSTEVPIKSFKSVPKPFSIEAIISDTRPTENKVSPIQSTMFFNPIHNLNFYNPWMSMLGRPDAQTPLYVHPAGFARQESDSEASDVSMSPTAQDLSGKNNG